MLTDKFTDQMRIRTLIVFLGALLVGRQALGQVTASAGADDEQLLRQWIRTIASDRFGGRKPMTEYEGVTTSYLAGQLEDLGLEPAFGGSWFQPFQMIAVTAKPVGNKISVRGKKRADLLYPEDLVIWTARAADNVEVPKAEYVFCGFGIHAPEYGWDDYAGIDVKGKIVIAMVNDPGYYDNTLFRGRNMTYYGRWLYKFEEARRQGAAGCLVLHNTEAASSIEPKKNKLTNVDKNFISSLLLIEGILKNFFEKGKKNNLIRGWT